MRRQKFLCDNLSLPGSVTASPKIAAQVYRDTSFNCSLPVANFMAPETGWAYRQGCPEAGHPENFN
jgi:hypothetical protein